MSINVNTRKLRSFAITNGQNYDDYNRLIGLKIGHNDQIKE